MTSRTQVKRGLRRVIQKDETHPSRNDPAEVAPEQKSERATMASEVENAISQLNERLPPRRRIGSASCEPRATNSSIG